MTNDSTAGVPVCYRHTDRESHIRCQRCERPICPDCMRDAAVGFQCPSCIEEGKRSTRQAQAAYGGARSANPLLTSYAIIAVNAAVWLAILATGWQSSRLVTRLALAPVGTCESIEQADRYYPGVRSAARCLAGPDGRWVPGVADGAVWQLVTNVFTHVEIWHILANMVSLYLLGPQIEAVLGRARFLAVYLVSGLTGSAVVYWLSDPGGYTLGASGAIYGIFGALAVIVHKIGGDLRQVGMLLAVNLVITFAVPNISWQGHLGGLLGGAAVTAALVYAPRGPRRSLVQWSAVGGLLLLVAVAVVVRTAVLV